MLAMLLLSTLLTPLGNEELPRSGVADRDLARLTKDVEAYFKALGIDDRKTQHEAAQRLEDAFSQSAKRLKVERSVLSFLGDWDYVLEESKPEIRTLRSSYGRGFVVHVFEDEVNDLRTAALLSLPANYDKDANRFPVIVGLKPVYGASGTALERQVTTVASKLYEDVLATHIVLVPLGHQTGRGRSIATSEVDESWMTPDGHDVFFTSLRILFEQIKFDRSRLVLDGWEGAGLDALRLVTNAPSFFAGVINRGGPVSAPDLVFENLFGLRALYVQGSSSPSDLAPLVGAEIPGVSVTRVDSGGSALEPSAEARASTREWLAEVRRDLVPTEIRYRPADVVFGSASWCQAAVVNRRASARLGDPDYPKMYARVDRENNVIDVETVNVLELRIYLSDALLDMEKAVTIRVNGQEMWKRTPRRSLRHLLDNRYFGNSGDYGLYTESILIEDIDRNVPGQSG